MEQLLHSMGVRQDTEDAIHKQQEQHLLELNRSHSGADTTADADECTAAAVATGGNSSSQTEKKRINFQKDVLDSIFNSSNTTSSRNNGALHDADRQRLFPRSLAAGIGKDRSHAPMRSAAVDTKVQYLSELKDIPAGSRFDPHNHAINSRTTGSSWRRSGSSFSRRGYNASTAKYSLNIFDTVESTGIVSAEAMDNRATINTDQIKEIISEAKASRQLPDSSRGFRSSSSSNDRSRRVITHDRDEKQQQMQQELPAVRVKSEPEVSITTGTLQGGEQQEESLISFCPVCGRDIREFLGKVNSNELVNSHVMRCSRRGSRRTAMPSYEENDHEGKEGKSSTGGEIKAKHSNTLVSRSRKSDARTGSKISCRSTATAGCGGAKSSTVQYKAAACGGSDSGSDAAGSVYEASSAEEDENEEETLRSSSEASEREQHRTRRRLTRNSSVQMRQRLLRSSSSCEAQQYADLFDEDEVNDEELLEVSREAFSLRLQDDWEDDAYLSRLAKYDRDDHLVKSSFGTQIHAATWNALYDYQKEGIEWLHNLYDQGVGGILGDEMGLGKTVQICAHFGSLALLSEAMKTEFQPHLQRTVRRRCKSTIFLIVCPATVLYHWVEEFHKWSPLIRVAVLHSTSTTGKELLQLGDSGIATVLRKLQQKPNTRGLVIITTYASLRKYRNSLASVEWSAVCLDEGQIIRNAAADISAVCKMLPAFHRLILSGTPIQNSLQELWSLFDFIYPGRLGSLPVFEQEFANPIRIGGYSNATQLQYELAIRCAATLQRMVKPYLLRRRKDQLAEVTKLPPKTEQVLFCQISPRQREIYLNILASSEVQAVIERKVTSFRAINTLRKLCNHPALVLKPQSQQNGHRVWADDDSDDGNFEISRSKKKRMRDSKRNDVREQLGTKKKKIGSPRNTAARVVSEYEDGECEEEDNNDEQIVDEFSEMLLKVGSGDVKWSDSGKLLVLSKVLPLWFGEGHKVLVFCQTRAILNLIELMVRELKFNYYRLDGSTPIGRRASLIHKFNTEPDSFLMLLTTRTGGVGISLTAANRVVLFDPDWNPMTDMQARERAWRIGQTREVTVYRLITRGTIEEKIYQRQIFKLLLSNRILDDPKQKALFTRSQIGELFVLNDGAADENAHPFQNSFSQERSALPPDGEVHFDYNQDGSAGETFVKKEPLTRTTPDTDSSIDNGVAANATEEDKRLVAIIENEERNEDGSNVRDRRLLKALFDGEAITSVYDHNYVDPTQKNRSSGDAAQQNATSQRAARLADYAARQLASSARVYNMPEDTTVVTSNAQVSSGDNNTITYLSSRMRPTFGSSLASGNQNSSSSSILREIQQVQSGRGASLSGSFTSDSALRTEANSVSADSVSGARATVQRDILNRLQALFNQPNNRRLTSAFILSKFRDLGDHYAPLFKSTLRSIATLQSGVWVKK